MIVAKLPNPDQYGISGVTFNAVIGSAVYFEMDANPNVFVGDSVAFTSTGGNPSWADFNGEYVVAGTSFDGAVYRVTTTCIATATVAGT